MEHRRIVVPAVEEILVESADMAPEKPAVTLVENRYTMVSPGTELSIYRGLNQSVNAANAYPVQIGYSAVGGIVDAPPDNSGFLQGELIFHPTKHRSHAYLDLSDGLSVSAEGFDDPKHALFIRFAQIACTALRVADFKSGDSVAVVGLGLIGQMAAQLFKINGAEVLAVDPLAYRRSAAETSGILSVEKIQDLTPLSFDIVVDATGNPSVTDPALEACRECGQFILLGSPRGLVEVNLYRYVHVRGIALTGAHERLQRFDKRNNAGQWTREANTAYVRRLLIENRLKVSHLITHTIAPEEAATLFDKMAKNEIDVIGIVIDWKGGGS